MGSSKQVLDVARGFLDRPTYELPGNPRNRVPGITDQGGFYPAAWCDAFCQTCLRAGGVDSGPQTMWVSTTMAYFRGKGRNFVEARHAKPGDLVAFEWGTTAGGYDHIGFVESVRADGLITIEGNIGDRVQRLFRGWNSGFAEFARPEYSETPAPSQPTPQLEIPYVVFRVGSNHPYVRTIQKIVGVAQDGIYGGATANAVRVWQSKLGLVSDGAWGPSTQAATDRLFAFLASTSSAPQQFDPALGGFLADLSAAMKETLSMKAKSRGNAVRILQEILMKKGVPVGGGADGIFGQSTNHAVKFFQGLSGLPQDGVVGPRTWSALTGG